MDAPSFCVTGLDLHILHLLLYNRSCLALSNAKIRKALFPIPKGGILIPEEAINENGESARTQVIKVE